MKRVQTTLDRILTRWPYLLAFIPPAADCISRGRIPTHPRSLITDFVSFILVVILVAVIQRKDRKLEEYAVTDKLTGLYNSRYLRVELDRQLALARRAGSPLSVIFLDVDNLKAVNDHRGHDVGSEVLRQFAEGLGTVVRRDMDLCFRFGGDEFLVLCPQTYLGTAEEVARRVCAVPALLPICLENGVTVSVGVIQLKADETAAALLARADAAMYAVKRAGKNRVGVG